MGKHQPLLRPATFLWISVVTTIAGSIVALFMLGAIAAHLSAEPEHQSVRQIGVFVAGLAAPVLSATALLRTGRLGALLSLLTLACGLALFSYGAWWLAQDAGDWPLSGLILVTSIGMVYIAAIGILRPWRSE